MSDRFKICTLSGDGIGPEIMLQAMRVLDKVTKLYGARFDCSEQLIGGCAIDASGTPYPEQTDAAC